MGRDTLSTLRPEIDKVLADLAPYQATTRVRAAFLILSRVRGIATDAPADKTPEKKSTPKKTGKTSPKE